MVKVRFGKEIVVNISLIGARGSGVRSMLNHIYNTVKNVPEFLVSSEKFSSDASQDLCSFDWSPINREFNDHFHVLRFARYLQDNTSFSSSLRFFSEADGILFVANLDPISENANIQAYKHLIKQLASSNKCLTGGLAKLQYPLVAASVIGTELDISVSKVPIIVACNKSDLENRMAAVDVLNAMSAVDTSVEGLENYDTICRLDSEFMGKGVFGIIKHMQNKIFTGIHKS